MLAVSGEAIIGILVSAPWAVLFIVFLFLAGFGDKNK